MEEKIYQELKSEFNKYKKNKKSNFLIYILAAVLIFWIYLFIHKDKNNEIHEVSKSLDYIQINWENIELSEVKIIKIPQEVYDSIGKESDIPPEIYNQISNYGEMLNLDEYLSWDKKRLLLITRDGCPYARKFHNAINKAFNDNEINSYYSKDIKTTWKYFSFPCFDGEICASTRLFDKCWEWFCIINPITKEIIADTSQNANQILPILKAYKSRYSEPILN